jgi:CHAT domain-containing protein
VADDRCTTELMVRLHRGLAAGDGAATALRAAQLATLVDHPHPFHWAPFIAVGAPSPMEII